MEDIIQQIFEVCVIPLMGILVVAFCQYVNAKKNQLIKDTDNELTKKYITMLSDTITSCVVATNQTYVENMKNQNAFDEEAQKKAFEMTFNAVMAVLTEEGKKYLNEAYGDLTIYITKKIEEQVNYNK